MTPTEIAQLVQGLAKCQTAPTNWIPLISGVLGASGALIVAMVSAWMAARADERRFAHDVRGKLFDSYADLYSAFVLEMSGHHSDMLWRLMPHETLIPDPRRRQTDQGQLNKYIAAVRLREDEPSCIASLDLVKETYGAFLKIGESEGKLEQADLDAVRREANQLEHRLNELLEIARRKHPPIGRSK